MFDALIQVIGDGPYYRVKLACLPHVGDTIALHSFEDEKTYKMVVKRVDHDVHSVAERVRVSLEGHHLPTVHVGILSVGNNY